MRAHLGRVPTPRSGAQRAAGVLALLLWTGSAAGAQTPTTEPSPTPAPSEAASASTAPAPLPPRKPRPSWSASGPADATVRRGPLTMRLWLSSTVVEPGQWLQAEVEVQNRGSRDRFHEGRGPCLGDPIAWDLDITGLFDPGIDWPGLAGQFKRSITAWPIPGWSGPDDGSDEVVVRRFAECTGGPQVGVDRLAPGASVRRTYAWYPQYMLNRPLPPGPVRLGVAFQDWGAGARPDRAHPPLSVEAAVLVAGPDPGYVSPYELVDRALSDPRFFAYVSEPPGRRVWVNPSWSAWLSIPSRQVRWKDLPPDLPGGLIEIGLFRDGPGAFYGGMNLDPWTGEVLSYGEE